MVLGWVDPGGGGFPGWSGRLLDEAFGMFGKGAVESGLTGGMDGIGLSVVDLVWGHQAQAGVVVVLVIPGEERPAERLGILDASEAAGEFRLILERLEVGLPRTGCRWRCAAGCATW